MRASLVSQGANALRCWRFPSSSCSSHPQRSGFLGALADVCSAGHSGNSGSVGQEHASAAEQRELRVQILSPNPAGQARTHYQLGRLSRRNKSFNSPPSSYYQLPIARFQRTVNNDGRPTIEQSPTRSLSGFEAAASSHKATHHASSPVLSQSQPGQPQEQEIVNTS